jgi:hypothetical protein
MATRKTVLRVLAGGGAVLFLLTAAWAGQQGGILFPNWSKATKGTYKEPAGDVGKKPSGDSPWSVTTVASSIEGKPLKGKAVTVVGEIIDLSCYLQVGKHGDKHRDCGQKCIKAGQPVGLLAENGDVYMLMDEEHDPRRDGLTQFRQWAVDHMAHIMTVHGTQTEVAGQKAIYVQGSVKK